MLVPKTLKAVLLVVALYVVSSGPAGGLIFLAVRHGLISDEFSVQAYMWHSTFYMPLLSLPYPLGATVLAYWRFCGWE